MGFALPEPHAAWTASLLGGAPLPVESGATCDDCAMCVSSDGRLPTAAVTFAPDVKCCSFVPALPNFLVGRILRDEDPAAAHGRRTVEARLAGPGVTPLGLERPPTADLLHRAAVNGFGNSTALLCPHFDGGRCGIWRHREAVCATWFCRFDRGAAGLAFWHALRRVLATVEADVARWCALEVGVDPERLAASLPRLDGDAAQAGPAWVEVEGRRDPALHAQRWGAWAGRERELYLACAAAADRLQGADVARLGGGALALRVELARRLLARLAAPRAAPARLRVAPFQVVTMRAGGVRVTTFSPLDALDLPSALVALLPLFDGRPTVEVLAELRTTHGVELTPDLLGRLLDWQVLVEA